MNGPTTSRTLPKSSSGPPSRNPLRSLISSKILQKQTGKFAAVLAHEVRNPLTNINLAVELLKSTLSEEEKKAYLGIIIRSSARINDLVSDLLAFDQEDDVLVKKHSIQLLLDEVLEMSDDRIRLKHISIQRKYGVHDFKIVMNRAEMKMALTNIIINAIDAMPPDTGALKLVTKSVAGKYILQIEDNGVGISKANLKNIFKPYYTNKLGGMGLGLSTTLAILHSNHAKVNVQSEEGQGTRFTLLFNQYHEGLT